MGNPTLFSKSSNKNNADTQEKTLVIFDNMYLPGHTSSFDIFTLGTNGGVDAYRNLEDIRDRILHFTRNLCKDPNNYQLKKESKDHLEITKANKSNIDVTTNARLVAEYAISPNKLKELLSPANLNSDWSNLKVPSGAKISKTSSELKKSLIKINLEVFHEKANQWELFATYTKNDIRMINASLNSSQILRCSIL